MGLGVGAFQQVKMTINVLCPKGKCENGIGNETGYFKKKVINHLKSQPNFLKKKPERNASGRQIPRVSNCRGDIYAGFTLIPPLFG